MGHYLISLDLVNPVLTTSRARSRMSFRPMVMDDDYVWSTSVHLIYSCFRWWFAMMACIIFMIISINGFIIIIIIMVLTWMEPLMYFFDGNIMYDYWFLVDLDILNPLVQLFSVSSSYKTNMGLLGFLQQICLGKLEIKQCREQWDLLGR